MDGLATGTIELAEMMGAEIYVYAVAGDANLIARVSVRNRPKAGDEVKNLSS